MPRECTKSGKGSPAKNRINECYRKITEVLHINTFQAILSYLYSNEKALRHSAVPRRATVAEESVLHIKTGSPYNVLQETAL